MGRRKIEPGAHVVEACGRYVFREHFTNSHVGSKEVLQGGFIFRRVQAPDKHAALSALLFEGGSLELRLQSARHRGDVCVGRPGLFLRGHLTRFNLIEYMRPSGGRFFVPEIDR